MVNLFREQREIIEENEPRGLIFLMSALCVIQGKIVCSN